MNKHCLPLLVISCFLALFGMPNKGIAISPPIALYHFDGNGTDAIDGSSATLLKEYGGSGLGNPRYTTTTKQVGTGCLDLSTYGSWATLPEGAAITGTNHWTLTFWVKRTADILVDYGDPLAFGSGKFRLEYIKPTSPDIWQVYETGYAGLEVATGASVAAEWQFWALTADGTSVRIYQGRNNGGTWQLTPYANYTIGQNERLNAGSTLVLGNRSTSNYGNPGLFTCWIDELAIWNKGLTSSEVQEVFQQNVQGASVTDPVRTPQTLVDEPFSTGGSIGNWSVISGSASLTWDAANGHGGAGCMSISAADNGTSITLRHSQRLPIDPDTLLDVEGFGCTQLDDRACRGGGIYMQIAWYNTGGQLISRTQRGITFYNDSTYGSSDYRGWTRIAGLTTADWIHKPYLPPDGTAYAYLELVCNKPGSPFMVDDVKVSTVIASAPRTWVGRPAVCLNGKWQMIPRPWNNTDSNTVQPGESWQTYWVPGYTVDNRTGESAWLKKTFTMPATFDSPRVVLHLERVQTYCDVYLNGTKVGSHLSDDLPFDIDITNTVHRSGSNELLIFVRNWLASFYPPIDPQQSFEWACWYGDQHPEQRLTHSAHWDWKFLGIPGDVLVLGSGTQYVTDVAVRSTLNPTVLSVSGLTAGANSLTASCDILDIDNDSLLLELPDVAVSASDTFSTSGAFSAGQLWWPYNPKLYVLRTQLFNAQGQLVDEHRERFGIRTVATSGDEIVFNGVNMHVRNSSNWFPTYRRYDAYRKEDMVKCFQWMQSVNVGTHRAHGSGHPRVVYQAADEAGELLIAEPPVPLTYQSALVPNTSYYQDFYRRWVRMTRNNPSVILRSVMNEFYSFDAGTYSVFQTPVTDLVNIVRQEQPDLPITFESDLDVYGLPDVLGLHYPDAYMFQGNWPDDLYWVGTTKYVNTPAYVNHQFNWTRQKPLCIGEFGWMNWFTPDLDATFLGDAAYQAIWDNTRLPHDLARAFGWFGMIEAYRNQDITGMGAWTLWENADINLANPLIRAVKQGFAPQVAFPREYVAHGFSGATVTRHLWVHNDSLTSANQTVHWEHQTASNWSLPDPADAVTFANRDQWRSFSTLEDPDDAALNWSTVSQNDVACQLSPAESSYQAIQITLPSVVNVTRGRLKIQVKQGGTVLWTGYRALDVWPTANGLTTARTVYLYDPQGSTHAAFDNLGIAHTLITDLNTAMSAAGKILVIGKNSLDNTVQNQRPGIESWVQNGGRVICFEQTAWKDWLPFSMGSLIDVGNNSIAHLRAPGHPMLSGFGASDFRFWDSGHQVASKAFLKPQNTPARALIDLTAYSGETTYGLDAAALFDAQIGLGLYLICTLDVSNRYATEPVAARLINRLVNYADTYSATAVQTCNVQTTDPAVQHIWDNLNLAMTETTPSQITNGAGKLLVIDHPVGGWGSLSGQASSLRSRVNEGMTLYVHDLDSTGLSVVADLLQTTINWIPQAQVAVPMHLMKNTAVTWGLSSQQLYWYGPPVTWTQIKQLLPATRAGVAVAAPHEVLVSDGLLVRVPCGSGQVIIDQVPWQAASGTNYNNDAQANRYINTLLRNLGAQDIVCSVLPSPIALYHFDGNGTDAIDGSTATLLKEYGGSGQGNPRYTTTTKQVGTGCLDLSTYGSWATLPEGAAITGTNHWTLTFWVKRTSNALIDYGDPVAFGSDKFRLEYIRTVPKWDVYETGYPNLELTPGSSVAAEWQFWALTADGTSVRIYQGRNSGGTWQLTPYANYSIGQNERLNAGSTLVLGNRSTSNYGNPGLFTCWIDELAIWNKGLSEAEVKKVFDVNRAGTNTSGVTLQGTVTLDDFVGDITTIPVTISILSNPIETHVVNLDVNGHYELNTSLTGIYSVTASAAHWLNKRQANVNLKGAVTADFVLTNGDCDGDNQVTSADVAIILAAMDSQPNDWNWTPTADLDGDSEITSTDLSIALTNLGLTGD